jgi:hypothetical protein
MTDRLDYLLSIELDDELDAAERAELDRLLVDHPDAAARRARLAGVDSVLQNIGAQPADQSRDLDAGLAAIRRRLGSENGESGPAPVDELARRRRRASKWIPSLGLAAAAALAVYLVTPAESPFFSDGVSGDYSDGLSESFPGSSSRGASDRSEDPERVGGDDTSADTVSPGASDRALGQSAAGESRLVDDPIALAVVFELEDDVDMASAIESVSADDFEIIEQLELLEFLAARKEGGRG